jgi:hypothetical protein
MKTKELSGVAGSRFGVPANRGGVLVALVAAGLAVAGLGFVAASIDAGPGPRAVHGAIFLGPVYLPPFLTGLAALAMAGLQLRRIRWAPAAGAILAAVLLVGAVSLGYAAVSWRLAHPGRRHRVRRGHRAADGGGHRHRRGDGANRGRAWHGTARRPPSQPPPGSPFREEDLMAAHFVAPGPLPVLRMFRVTNAARAWQTAGVTGRRWVS